MTADAGRIVLAGGGSAGHVNPLLATADRLRAHGYRVTVLGTAEGLEAELVPEAGYDLTVIPRVPFPRRPNAAAFKFPAKWRAALALSRGAITHDPATGEADLAAVVVGFGGFVATPAYLAARALGVPIVIHEQNARPGLANRLGARFADAVALTFASTPLKGRGRTETVGLPLRGQIADLITARKTDRDGARAAGAAALGLDPNSPILLVTGGSLGAQSLNDVVPEAAADILATGAQVLHLTGNAKQLGTDVPAGYQAREYLREMHHALACADLVIGRAGAGMVAELTALGIPAIYVPYPVGNGEQRLNATDVVAAGGGLLVLDRDFTPAWVRAHVLPLLTDSATRDHMATRSAHTGVTNGAERLVHIIAEVAS